MSSIKLQSFKIALFPLVIATLSYGAQAQTQNTSDAARLFTSQGAATIQRNNLLQSQSDRVLQERAVAINFRSLYSQVHPKANAGIRSASIVPEKLVIDLFDGKSINLKKIRVIERSPLNYTWVGEVDGAPLSQAVVTVLGNKMTASINIAGKKGVNTAFYTVRSKNDGQHFLQQIDQLKQLKETPPPMSNLASTNSAPVGSTSLTLATATANAKSVIDVMVLFTSKANSKSPADFSMAQHAIDMTNQAYVNSGINSELRLVFGGVENYDEPLGANNLSIGFPGHGKNLSQMASVAQKRAAYGADLVVFVVAEDTGDGGYASGLDSADPNNYWVVVAQGAGLTGNTLAHEFGHLHGALHDTYVTSTNIPFPWSHGYVNTQDQVRDIMSYPNQCRDLGLSWCYGEINYFSSPSSPFGKTLGNTTTANATRAHVENAAKLASLKPSIVQITYGGNAAKIYRLYKTVFDRSPDMSGLGYWMWSMDTNGQSLASISTFFINTPFFQEKNGQYMNPSLTSNDLFAYWFYVYVYKNNNPTEAQKATIVKMLNDGLSRSDVFFKVSQSEWCITQNNDVTEVRGMAYIPYIASRPTFSKSVIASPFSSKTN